ncbi:alkaline phosphatase D family protein [Indioceanicola profundi]|uniref:alkaline phosphatase D family protein n=1 Tax=Indioceanicola profundi TaxID=2220096 RepID=UPI000E6ADA9D|nr:alkaline phosphatase D family protein [Indioceanicola profundi]
MKRSVIDPRRLTRRQLIQTFGAAATAALSIPFAPSRALAQPTFVEYPFQLGVAAGDPLPDGFVIWTRLAPRPFEPGHGMPRDGMEVEWQVAADERFRKVVQSGTAVARPELAHAVHVEVTGLEPGRPYWYRFTSGRERSITGRARTAPAAGAAVERLRFAVAGCQEWSQGLYTAYSHLAAEADLDFVYHYGDYIYEYGSRPLFFSRYTETMLPTVRPVPEGECFSLDDYRRRYALYKMDPNLQLAHAAAAWISVWDDHEVVNNWVEAHGDDDVAPEIFLLRRVAAAQAYYEHLPFRRSSWPLGPEMQLFRRFGFGSLLDMNVLDTRQYRSDQPCGDGFKKACEAVDSEEATVLGERQEKWLLEGIDKSRANWNVLAQQIMFMPLDRDPSERDVRNLDSWDAYLKPRRRLTEFLGRRKQRNTIILTGDEHQNYAGEVHRDPMNPDSEKVAAEFVTTSISSGGDGGEHRPWSAGILAENPHLKLLNDQRGYVVCDVTPNLFQTHFKVLDQVSRPGGNLSTRAIFAVEQGRADLAQV